jgi:hypothetical protein
MAIQVSNLIDHFAIIIVWTKCLPPSITKPNNFFCYKPISLELFFRSTLLFVKRKLALGLDKWCNWTKFKSIMLNFMYIFY